mmetsp:Transcript_13940/g.20403  ORF Transcript_13940/g.20403 Transcript_13940/m.20403 type:complete len:201 (-) Transcript_13940:76-678(-)
MNSSINVWSGTSSSTNSCRSMATLKSFLLLTTSPVVGSISPDMMRNCVVFPAPLCPTRPMRSPVCTPHVTSFNTSWSRNVIPMFSRRREEKLGWADSMTRMRGGGRSFRMRSSSVILFFCAGGAWTASPWTASPLVTSGTAASIFSLASAAALLAAILASLAAFLPASFSAFLAANLASFLLNFLAGGASKSESPLGAFA